MSEHSRFDEEHYRNCQDCYEDHLDFMQEQAMDAHLDAMAEASELEQEYLGDDRGGADFSQD